MSALGLLLAGLEVRGQAAHADGGVLTVRPYLSIDGAEVRPAPVNISPEPGKLTADWVATRAAVVSFGIALESDTVVPLSPGMPEVAAGALRRPAVTRYPYDWTWRRKNNVLNCPRLILPGVMVDGTVYVVDTHELWSLRLERTDAGRVRALLLQHTVSNDGGDIARPQRVVRAGERMTFTVHTFRDVASANRARFGDHPPLRGTMTQPAYRGWTGTPLTEAQYRRIAERLAGVVDMVLVREDRVRPRLPPLFHEQGLKVFSYQYLGALRRNSCQLNPQLAADIGLKDAQGRLYTAPTSPDGAWLLCDIRREEVLERFVTNACAAIEAGFDGVFLDGYPFWADAEGKRGGSVPGVDRSLAYARWRLLHRVRHAIKAADPDARLGALANQYYDALGEADLVTKELMYCAWGTFARQFSDRVTLVNSQRDVGYETQQAPFIPAKVMYGVKGYSPISVQTCLHLLRRPSGLFYLGMGDFFPSRYEQWLEAIRAIATERDLYIASIEPVTAWVRFEGLSTISADIACKVTFSVPVCVRGKVSQHATRSLDMQPGIRYDIRDDCCATDGGE